MNTGVQTSGPLSQRRLCLAICVIAGIAAALLAGPASAQYTSDAQGGRTPQRARTNVNVDERLAQTLPLNLPFVAQDGSAVTLADYWADGKPVIVVLAYYECPMLCTQVLNALHATMEQIAPGDTLGTTYRIVTVSINPNEGPELATVKHEAYCEGYTPEASADWAFLTGEEENIQALADAIGFRYFFDARLEQYAHPAVITFTTPTGRISNYIYGIEYPPTDVSNSLEMAREDRIAGVMQQLGETLPRELKLTTDDGEERRLGNLIVPGKPLVLMLDYQSDPTPTGKFREGIAQMVSDPWFPVADNYRLLTVSLDPDESIEHLHARAEATRSLAKVSDPAIWRFARTDAAGLRRLADTVGIGYTGSAADGFIAPEVLVIVTPAGVVSSYRLDTYFALKEFKLGLVDASRGEIGSVLDRIILSCFHYDPDSMGYVLVARKAMRLGGAVILVFMIVLLTLLWRLDGRRKRAAAAAEAAKDAPQTASDP